MAVTQADPALPSWQCLRCKLIAGPDVVDMVRSGMAQWSGIGFMLVILRAPTNSGRRPFVPATYAKAHVVHDFGYVRAYKRETHTDVRIVRPYGPERILRWTDVVYTVPLVEVTYYPRRWPEDSMSEAEKFWLNLNPEWGHDKPVWERYRQSFDPDFTLRNETHENYPQ